VCSSVSRVFEEDRKRGKLSPAACSLQQPASPPRRHSGSVPAYQTSHHITDQQSTPTKKFLIIELRSQSRDRLTTQGKAQSLDHAASVCLFP
jgi:hypothetical protein